MTDLVRCTSDKGLVRIVPARPDRANAVDPPTPPSARPSPGRPAPVCAPSSSWVSANASARGETWPRWRRRPTGWPTWQSRPGRSMTCSSGRPGCPDPSRPGSGEPPRVRAGALAELRRGRARCPDEVRVGVRGRQVDARLCGVLPPDPGDTAAARPRTRPDPPGARRGSQAVGPRPRGRRRHVRRRQCRSARRSARGRTRARPGTDPAAHVLEQFTRVRTGREEARVIAEAMGGAEVTKLVEAFASRARDGTKPGRRSADRPGFRGRRTGCGCTAST